MIYYLRSEEERLRKLQEEEEARKREGKWSYFSFRFPATCSLLGWLRNRGATNSSSVFIDSLLLFPVNYCRGVVLLHVIPV